MPKTPVRLHTVVSVPWAAVSDGEATTRDPGDLDGFEQDLWINGTDWFRTADFAFDEMILTQAYVPSKGHLWSLTNEGALDYVPLTSPHATLRNMTDSLSGYLRFYWAFATGGISLGAASLDVPYAVTLDGETWSGTIGDFAVSGGWDPSRKSGWVSRISQEKASIITDAIEWNEGEGRYIAHRLVKTPAR